MVKTYYILKNKINDIFYKHKIVKFITIINECYLVEDINNNKREWIMKYNLYPINIKDLSYFKCESDILQYVPDKYYKSFNNDFVELLNIINDNEYEIKYLDDNKKSIVNKNSIIKINENLNL